MPHFLAMFCATLTALILGTLDHRSGRMPNRWTMGSLLAALVLKSSCDGWHGFVHAALGLCAAAVLPLGLFYFTRGRALGGGDVKALGALGAWLGPVQGLEAEFLAFLILALFAVAKEALQGRALALLGRSFSLLIPNKRGPRASPEVEAPLPELTELRFGPSLALGTLLTCAAALTRDLPWLRLLS